MGLILYGIGSVAIILAIVLMVYSQYMWGSILMVVGILMFITPYLIRKGTMNYIKNKYFNQPPPPLV